MRLFEEAVTGENGMSPEAVLQCTYGLYLLHGGTPDGFQDLDGDDVMSMYISYTGIARRETTFLLKNLYRMLGGKE